MCSLGPWSRACLLTVAEDEITRGVSRGSLARRMQGGEKSNKRGCFGRAQILSIGRHVATALDYLPYQLVLREADGNAV